MECVQEYIKLFENNRGLIDEPCTQKLNDEREKAFVRFKTNGFPKIKDENWLHTNVAKKFETDYGMDLGRKANISDVKGSFTCDVPNLKTVRGYIVNDSFIITDNDLHKLPQGVVIGNINTVAEQKPELPILRFLLSAPRNPAAWKWIPPPDRPVADAPPSHLHTFRRV